jgi:NADPH2:quinone reductase
MRAIHYDRQGAAHDVLEVGDLPMPVAGTGEVLVRVHRSGVNPSDVKNRTGFASKMKFDRVIPHQDGAGVIEAVGEGVPSDRVGQRVWIYEAQYGRAGGTAADYVAVPSGNAVPLPDGTSFDVGAALGVPAMTAHRCLFADGDLRGRRVMVHGGAGAVGSAAVQLAKWAGAWVVATIRRPEQADTARRAGADLVLNLRDGDVVADVEAATNGTGVDRIVDVDIVSNGSLDLGCLANSGSISAYSVGDPSATVQVPVMPFMLTNGAVRFVYVYTMPEAAKHAAVDDITACLRDDAYHPAIGLVLPLDRTADAHVAVETGAVTGKVLIQVADS